MANNPYKNKIVYNGTTLIDLTGDTVAPSNLLSGYTAHDASGAPIIGSAPSGSGTAVTVIDTQDTAGGTIRSITAVSLAGDTVAPSNLLTGYTAHNSLGQAIVGTASGGSATLITKSISANGTYNASSDSADGYSQVTVSVPVGADIPIFVYDENGDMSCNKTFAECLAMLEGEYAYDTSAQLTVRWVENNTLYYYTQAVTGRYDDENPSPSEIIYTEVNWYGAPYVTFTYYSDGTITVPANYSYESKTVHANGTYYATSQERLLGSVTVSVPTGTARTSDDLTVSGATVTVPAGLYSSQASKSVASGTVTAPASITGTSSTVSTGTNSITLSKTVSVTPNVTTAGYVSSGTAGNSSVSLTASVTTKGATTYNTSSSDQTIASGTYLTGTQTIRGVTTSNLTADNIKQGVTVTVGDSADADRVLSVTGTYSGGSSSKAIYTYKGLASRTANSYGATNATVTVTKAGTYTISYVAIRGSSSGTMGTNLHIGNTSGTNQQTWNNGTYGQYVTLTNQTISANTAVTIYATSGNASRTIYVGQLIVEEQ